MLAENLSQLETSGLIRLVRQNPDLAYLFRHALVQEAAYDSILKADRKMLHLAVAEEIEQLYHDHLDENAALLGYHFREGGMRDKAREYFSRAADYAASKFANAEAETSLRAALDLSPGEQEKASLSLRLGMTLTLMGLLEEAREFFQQAMPFYIKDRDFDQVAAIYGMFAQIAWGLNDVVSMLEITEEGLKVVGEQPPGKGLADLLRWAAAGCVFNNKLDEGTTLVHRALEVSRQANAHTALAHSLTTLGVIYDQLGRPEQAIESFHQAIAIAEQYNLINPNARARNNLASLLMTMGRLAEAAEQYEYMVTLCYQENMVFFKIWFLSQLGLVCLERGQIGQAFELLEQLDIEQKATGGNTYREQYDEFLALTCYYTGGADQAQEILTKILETTNNRQTIMSTAIEKAAILQDAGGYAEAATLIERGVHEGGTWSSAEQWYILAGARALAGDAAGARRDIAYADDMIDPSPGSGQAQPNFLADVERIRAEINLDMLETRYAAATEKYRNLAGHYHRAEYRWRYARTLCDWADACLKASQPDAAGKLFDQAASEFEEMNIQLYAQQARQRLAELNHPD